MEQPPGNPDSIHLIVLNIICWYGISAGATHYYARIIFVSRADVTLDNIREFDIATFGEWIELKRVRTRKECEKLDFCDGGDSHRREFDSGKPVETARFDSIDQITQAGILYWRGLEYNVPFISLKAGKKFPQTVINTDG